MFAKVYRDGTVFATRETQEAGCDQGIFVDIFPYDFLSRMSALRRSSVARRNYGSPLRTFGIRRPLSFRMEGG